MSSRPIGIFDSGIGGLSVVAEMQDRLINENIIYFADTLNYPYGTKSSSLVKTYFNDVTNFLEVQDVKTMLCACSTASAVAVPHVSKYLSVPLVGMFNDALVRKITHESANKTVALIATELTVSSHAFEDLFASSLIYVTIKSVPANKLVEIVTKGDFSDKVIMPVVEETLRFFDLDEISSLIIGCTHFYHIKKFLKKYLKQIPIIEPASVAVDCLNQIMEKGNLLNQSEKRGITRCYVSGDLDDFKKQVKKVEEFHNRKFIDEYSRGATLTASG